MTTVESQRVAVDAPVEDVWGFISDPRKRSEPISVVSDFEIVGDGESVWHVELPIPMVSKTFEVRAVETSRNPPYNVAFEAESKPMVVNGMHDMGYDQGWTVLYNEFGVEGRLPGVESYFSSKLDAELAQLESAIADDLGTAVRRM